MTNDDVFGHLGTSQCVRFDCKTANRTAQRAIICSSSYSLIMQPPMRLVSSKMTCFYKRVLPVIWFGFLLFFIAFGLFSPSRDSQGSSTPFLIAALLMAVFGYWIMKKMMLFNLADAVLDAGDALLVRTGGQEERIALSDIKNVNYSPYMNPPLVTLSVRRHTAFGDTIAFCATGSIMPLWSSPVIQDLIDRVDAARRKREAVSGNGFATHRPEP
jgi:hypothetical protein